MDAFTDQELEYLRGERRLGRIATVGEDGTPHVTPVGWGLRGDGLVVVGGRDLTSTKKYRDVVATGRAALVIDDVLPPWRPRAVTLRGRAEVTGEPDARILIHPDRVVSWGLDQ